MGFWDQTQNDIQNLRDHLDQSGTSVARATLLHYSLFTYFKRVGAAQLFLEHVIDFSTYVYANTVQIVCPYLLRYLAAAAILMRKKRSVLKKVAKMAEQEAHAYSDSFTQFLVSVTELDFPTANECLKKLAVEAETDFFLKEHKEDLIKAARMMVYEDYLRVHRTVSIPAVAAQLGMDVDKAEIWLVTLIQEAKIDAEVDSVSRKILVTPAARTVHRDVISRLETIARPVN
jgi:translation initiation factor 3 subunit E